VTRCYVPRMRQMWFTAACALAACGGGGAPPTVDATVTIIDGVIIFPDAPVPDATSATTGAITVTMRCGGGACGLAMPHGLHLVADDCAGGVPVANKYLGPRTMMAGVDINNTIDSLAPAMYCVTSYLDVNDNFKTDAGDYVATAGATHATVVVGVETPAVIVLDKLSP